MTCTTYSAVPREGGEYSNPKLLAEMNEQLAVLDDPPKSLLF